MGYLTCFNNVKKGASIIEVKLSAADKNFWDPNRQLHQLCGREEFYLPVLRQEEQVQFKNWSQTSISMRSGITTFCFNMGY